MDAADLARWTRFAAKGGIGKCIALSDCVAERPEDLMFLKDDEITVLMQLPDQDGEYLGYCEGVVGRFKGTDVRFLSKLKRPVMAKRSSVTASISGKSPTPSLATSPSPSSHRPVRHSDPPPPKDTSIVHQRLPPPIPTTTSVATRVSSPPVAQSSPQSPSGTLTDEESVPPSMSFSASSSSSPALITPPRYPPAFAISKGHEVQESTLIVQDESVARAMPVFHQVNDPLDPEQGQVSHPPSSAKPPTPLVQLAVCVPESSYPPEASFEDSEPSTRISVAMSDGELGIGLSLLQDLVSGEADDDWSSTRSSSYSFQSRVQTPENISEDGIKYGDSPSTPLAKPDPSTSPVHVSESPQHSRQLSSPTSIKPSERGEDWEGASDIYDDYRYSRFSMASKVSRFSQSSQHPSLSGATVPPVPNDPRPITEKRQSSESEVSVRTHSPKISGPSAKPGSPLLRNHHVPSPLNLAPAHSNDRPTVQELVASPLLHTSWPSPLTSPEIQTGDSAFSGGMNSPPFSPSSGIASALRQRFETQRSSPSTLIPETNETEGDPNLVGRGIVIEDNEEEPFAVRHAASQQGIENHSSPSSSAPSSPQLPPTGDPSPVVEEPHSPQLTMLSPPSLPESTPFSPPLNVAPPPAPSVSPNPFARPSLSELRGQSMPGSGARTSLFQPHPNAPKPNSSSSGPMYTRGLEMRPPINAASNGHLIHTIHMALASRFHSPTSSSTRGPTIYGRCEVDLISSAGPVPIAFMVEPPPAAAPPPRAAPAFSAPPEDDVGKPPSQALVPASVDLRDSGATGDAIPRANFLPKAGTARPRSRSFSGFNSADTSTSSPTRERSQDEGIPGSSNSPTPLRSKTITGTTPIASSPLSSSPSPVQQPGSPKPPAIRASHAPSPLSLPQNNSVAARSPLGKTSTSSFSPSTLTPGSPTSSRLPHRLRHVTSAGNLSEQAPPSLTGHSLPKVTSDSPATSPVRSTPLYTFTAPEKQNTGITKSRESLSSTGPRPSVDVDGANGPEVRNQTVSPVLIRNTSLRSKLSLPNLRRKQSRQDETSSINSGPGGFDTGVEGSETMQVKDMDFELVRPTIPHIQSSRTSEDSAFSPRDPSIDVRSEFLNGFLRTDSPSISVSSGGASVPRSPTSDVPAPWPRTLKGSDSESTMDAHRQREQKWVALMSSSSPSQARKNKKVKKLLLEGVPSSVRYLVWAYLSDSKAKTVPGVYTQLIKRERVQAFGDIERDVRRCFADHPQLQSIEGPLLSLLQAYLTMVPDIQYKTDLTLIAGHLLILTPEEDAFWIFVSLMDTYLRSYFSSSTIQMEVDAALFSKALESNDPQVAKKVLVDMGITPITICSPWLRSMFASSLPIDYLHRVWDLFLSEGISFLIRVGLGIVYCCRRQILESNSEEVLLKYLLHPSPTWLPPTLEGFITLVYSFKLKDDDVRKLRVKMEAQVKRQTQTRATLSTPSAISLPR